MCDTMNIPEMKIMCNYEYFIYNVNDKLPIKILKGPCTILYVRYRPTDK